jgi:hypothetical protein
MSAPRIALEQIVVQAEDAIVSDMNGEKVMMSVSKGKYYNLGEVGGRIWELMAEPTTVGNMIDLLTAEYDVSREVCEEQVAAFLDQLRGEELIRVLNAAVPG